MRHPQVPLPGGGLRRRLRRAQGMPPGAPGRRAVRVDKHDRRLFTPIPWGSPSWKRGPPFRLGADLQPGRQRLRRSTTSAACGRLRLGLVTVVATALGCLRAERQGGRWLARSGCATDRGGRPTAPPKLAAGGHGPARPGFAAQCRSDRIFSLCSAYARLRDPCGSADGRPKRFAGIRADGSRQKTARRKRLQLDFHCDVRHHAASWARSSQLWISGSGNQVCTPWTGHVVCQ